MVNLYISKIHIELFWQEKLRCLVLELQTSENNNIHSYFLHWNFDWKSCFVVFFHEWNEWKNLQFNFSSQDLSIERNFFKWDGKVTKILHLLFHRIRKNKFFESYLRKLDILLAFFLYQIEKLIMYILAILLLYFYVHLNGLKLLQYLSPL